MPHYFEHLNLLILPTDACNMNCVYCFHKPYSKSFTRIDIQTIEHLLDITMPHYKYLNIIWHGGEPLLMGLDFYKKVLALQQEYAQKYNCKINNSVQSNLTLLTPEMADFFAENNISVSGSFDGVCNEQLRGCSESILAGRQLMIDRGKRCGLIMVVSGANIDHLVESYNFFKTIGVNFSLNFYLEQKDSQKSALTLDENIAIRRVSELFDYWATDSTGNIHISYFRNILDFLLFQKKSVCSFTSCMGRWLGVHPDGMLGPCNRYFPDEYSFGNVLTYEDIGEAFESSGFTNLLTKAIERREKCKSCEIFDFCCGGCNNIALNENGLENNAGLSCRLLRGIYRHIAAFVSTLLDGNVDTEKYNPLLIELIKKYHANSENSK